MITTKIAQHGKDNANHEHQPSASNGNSLISKWREINRRLAHGNVKTTNQKRKLPNVNTRRRTYLKKLLPPKNFLSKIALFKIRNTVVFKEKMQRDRSSHEPEFLIFVTNVVLYAFKKQSGNNLHINGTYQNHKNTNIFSLKILMIRTHWIVYACKFPITLTYKIINYSKNIIKRLYLKVTEWNTREHTLKINQ